MRTLRNFIYKNNDIIIALLILIIAAGLIFDRVSLIMAYPDRTDRHPLKTIVLQHLPPALTHRIDSISDSISESIGAVTDREDGGSAVRPENE